MIFSFRRSACLLAVATSMLLSGCACPEVVPTTKVSDYSLNCEQLQREIAECDKARQRISSEKGVTGKNVAAALFFWPGLIATHMNVNDAVHALDNRQQHLMKLYQDKKCAVTYPVTSTS